MTTLTPEQEREIADAMKEMIARFEGQPEMRGKA